MLLIGGRRAFGTIGYRCSHRDFEVIYLRRKRRVPLALYRRGAKVQLKWKGYISRQKATVGIHKKEACNER
jgi:hypothetical protein